MSDDLFEGVLTLEDDLYTRGYADGFRDGERAGKIEGRSVGMAKGFDKFVESGRLYGRSVVWANRIPSLSSAAGDAREQPAGESSDDAKGPRKACTLPPLPENARLVKNVESVHALMEPGTLSTENSDEAVQDFDERFRKAQGKARVVERMLGGKGHGAKDGEA